MEEGEAVIREDVHVDVDLFWACVAGCSTLAAAAPTCGSQYQF